MVTNTELTIDQITQETLLVLKNKLALGNRCIREFDGRFGINGAKIGDNLRIRVPVRYQSTTGPAAAAQNFSETYKDIAAQTQRNVVLNFSTKDMALAVDEFSARVIRPAINQLASDIDTDGTLCATSGYSVTNSGYVTANYAGTYSGFLGLATPGPVSQTSGPTQWTGQNLGAANLGVAGASPQANAGAPFFVAQAILTNQGAPYEERYAVLSPQAAATLAPNLYTLFNPTALISQVVEEGTMNGGGMFAGAKFFESPSVQVTTSGTWSNGGNSNVSVTATSGATTLALGNVGPSAIVNSGDQFVVSGVFSVNPLTRLSTQQLQVFVVTGGTSANAAGNVTVNVYPAIANSGQYQTVTALPAAGNTVTWMGANNTSTAANFMYNKNAIALAVAPLDEELDGATVSRIDDDIDGLSLRFVKQYQASTDLKVARIDILYGWAVVRPELGVLMKA